MTQRKTNAAFSSNFIKIFAAAGIGFMLFAAGYGFGSGQASFGNLLNQDNQQSGDLPDNLDYASVEQVYDSLKENFAGELNADELLDGLKDGLAKASGDPYTEFLDKEEAADFQEDLSGKFSGIGAELGKDGQSIIVVAPIAGFPAEKAGLLPQDVIAKINDESAFDLSLSEAVSKIRGPEGTEVKLTVIRDQSEELTLNITRAEITIPSVEYEINGDKIGIVTISRFGEDTTQLVREAAAEFAAKQVKGVVLDMRNNPGGLLDSSVDVPSLWLDSGQVVLEEKRGDTVIKTYRASGPAPLKNLPTVVLINEGSASASEITAGALKDNGAATLVGEKSFGKGSVQRLVEFNNGTQLKVTIAKWFTPNGRNIDQEGIEPDKKVEMTAEDIKAKRDPQLDAALQQLK